MIIAFIDLVEKSPGYNNQEKTNFNAQPGTHNFLEHICFSSLSL